MRSRPGVSEGFEEAGAGFRGIGGFGCEAGARTPASRQHRTYALRDSCAAAAAAFQRACSSSVIRMLSCGTPAVYPTCKDFTSEP